VFIGWISGPLSSKAILPPSEPKGILSWETVTMGPVLTASNGLQWRVCELKHRHRPDEKRRGKLYDLSHVVHNPKLWERLDTQVESPLRGVQPD